MSLEADVSPCQQSISGTISIWQPIPSIEIKLLAGNSIIAQTTTNDPNYLLVYKGQPSQNMRLQFSPHSGDGVYAVQSFDLENIKCNDNINLDADLIAGAGGL